MTTKSVSKLSSKNEFHPLNISLSSLNCCEKLAFEAERSLVESLEFVSSVCDGARDDFGRIKPTLSPEGIAGILRALINKIENDSEELRSGIKNACTLIRSTEQPEDS